MKVVRFSCGGDGAARRMHGRAQAVYCHKDVTTGRYKSHPLKGEEVAYVDSVTLVGNGKDRGAKQQANIKLRFNRNPVIGDKFASRAGQKGVLSIL